MILYYDKLELVFVEFLQLFYQLLSFWGNVNSQIQFYMMGFVIMIPLYQVLMHKTCLVSVVSSIMTMDPKETRLLVSPVPERVPEPVLEIQVIVLV